MVGDEMQLHIANPGAKERAASNREKALALRISGKPFAAIGKELGVSGPQAFRYVKRSLAELAAREQGLAEQQRQLDLARLDKALTGVMPKAEAGDSKAVLALCRLLERRSKLLGLDAPVRHLHGGDPESGPIMVEQLSETERVLRLRQLIDTAMMRQTNLPSPSVPLLEYTPTNGHFADGSGGVDPDD